MLNFVTSGPSRIRVIKGVESGVETFNFYNQRPNWSVKTKTTSINTIIWRRPFTWLWRWQQETETGRHISPPEKTLRKRDTQIKWQQWQRSLSKDYSHPDDHTWQTTDTPGFKLYSGLESRNIRCVIWQEMRKSSGVWKRLLNYCLYTQSRSSSDSTIINYYTVPLSFLNTKRVSLIC